MLVGEQKLTPLPFQRRSSRTADLPIPSSVYDDELEKEIIDILRTCGTHGAGISIRRQFKSNVLEHQTRTIVVQTESGKPRITSSGNEMFHIASITKILIAAAVIIAIETNSAPNVPEKQYSGFKDIGEEPLTKVYNQNSTVKMKAIPENPTIYHFLTHSRGFLSANHRLFGPCGTPLMAQTEARDELLSSITDKEEGADKNKTWAGYSNVNYVAVALVIEAVWQNSLDTFMNDTLFNRLKMGSTSIGLPANRTMGNSGWTVDDQGCLHEIRQPTYRADGAEAAALGAYSTVKDLDTFFKFVIDTFYDSSPLPGFDISGLQKLLKMTYQATELLHFTALGLFTKLDHSTIGALSTNRLQFPDELFSTYNVLPKQEECMISVYYMAGSAIGCGCATALHLNENEESFVVTVLTDTSGPVDSADHILRLILQKIAQRPVQGTRPQKPGQLSNVKHMVNLAMVESRRKWTKRMEKIQYDIEHAPKISKNIEGIFYGDSFSQRLEISKRNGKHFIAVKGTSASSASDEFQLVWVDKNLLRMCVSPHLSVDSLGNGDWSNLDFKAEGDEQTVTELIRRTASGEDRFLRR
ncbi:beta-lactamase/transpeptidase-like protein [Dendryphion nanum]|uniref:Beta-lactamase/transpeptidase-like protein n=1 Tax=Dendryphion nanum TaxID=256645 RepID=A0A9P9I7N5_9PLEO|nr:beta-lactamase/transpeptidase-like protein [Dendryphion nanum]